MTPVVGGPVTVAVSPGGLCRSHFALATSSSASALRLMAILHCDKRPDQSDAADEYEHSRPI